MQITRVHGASGAAQPTTVFPVGTPSGDATGAMDTAAIRAAIATAQAAGGGIVQTRAGLTYQVAPAPTLTALNPSGSTASRSVCITLPSGVTLDMQGSTLQLRGSTEATVVAPAQLDNVARTTDIGLRNAVIDGRSIAATSHSLLHFAYCDRIVLDNVKIINGVYQGGWVYDVTRSHFDRLDANTFQGQPWTLGAPQATGSGNNQIYDSTFGALLAQNITLLNTGSQPGNPYNLVLTRCSIDSIRVRNCSAGVKLQQPSTDVTIGMVLLDTCGEATALNSGMKIQGDQTYPSATARPVRIRVGTVISVNQVNIGLYLFHTQDCSVESYIGRNNVSLHTASGDVYLSGGIRDYVGRIDSVDSGGAGIRISDGADTGPTGYRLPDVRVTNPGRTALAAIRSAVRIDATSSGTFGRVVAIDDQGSPTMTHGIQVAVVSNATASVDKFEVSGYVTAPYASTSAGVGNPHNQADQLTAGEEIFARDLMTNGSGATVSQTLRLSYFTCRKTESTTGVRLVSGGTAAGATPTLVRVGLYEIDSSGNGTLVASIASDTALFAATNTSYARSWTTPYTKVTGRRYAVGVLVVTAATAPTLSGIPSVSTTADISLDPRLTGSIAAQADLPAIFTAGSLTTSFTRFYAAMS